MKFPIKSLLLLLLPFIISFGALVFAFLEMKENAEQVDRSCVLLCEWYGYKYSSGQNSENLCLCHEQEPYKTKFIVNYVTGEPWQVKNSYDCSSKDDKMCGWDEK